VIEGWRLAMRKVIEAIEVSVDGFTVPRSLAMVLAG
jgi:hypothetical protein